MKRRFCVIFMLVGMLLLSNTNSVFALDCSMGYQRDKVPKQENVNDLEQGDCPKTRSLIKSVGVWNHGTYLEVVFNANIGMVICTLTNTSGNTISTGTVDSDIQPIANINLPQTQGTYLLNIVSSSGYHAYAIISM